MDACTPDQVKDLREKNEELVQRVQYWMMLAAQRENEKLELMKDNNDLRLKLNRLRSGGAALSRKLDEELQSASEKVLAHLVEASDVVTRATELTKAYMRDREELETSCPRWTNITGTPKKEKIHRVPPMMLGGQSIQPVVSLSRTLLNTSNPRSTSTQNRNTSQLTRSLPMPIHMLQDVYIPLTRIDLPVNNADNENSNSGDEADIGIEESEEEMSAEYENIPALDMVVEDSEPEGEIETTAENRSENPLEGPSWLLDAPNLSSKSNISSTRTNLEPDSTTELDGRAVNSTASNSTERNTEQEERGEVSLTVACAFSPTRRRKRTSSPPPSPVIYSPTLPLRKNCVTGRVLKVLVAKMRLDDDDDENGDPSPSKRTKPGATSPRNNSKTRLEKLEEQNVTQTLQQKRLTPEGSSEQTPQSRQRLLSSENPSPILPCSSRHVTDVRPKRLAPEGSSQNRVPIVDLSRRTTFEASQSVILEESPECRSSNVATKRPPRFDAPSPNGATVAGVIVSETSSEQEEFSSGDSIFGIARNVTCCNTLEARDTNTQPKAANSHARETSSRAKEASTHTRETKTHSREPSINLREATTDPRNASTHEREASTREREASTREREPSTRERKPSTRVRDTSTRVREARNHTREASNLSRETSEQPREASTYVRSASSYAEESNRCSNRDSDSSGTYVTEGRTRRPRKPVIYKEKPLNRKMRR